MEKSAPVRTYRLTLDYYSYDPVLDRPNHSVPPPTVAPWEDRARPGPIRRYRMAYTALCGEGPRAPVCLVCVIGVVFRLCFVSLNR